MQGHEHNSKESGGEGRTGAYQISNAKQRHVSRTYQKWQREPQPRGEPIATSDPTKWRCSGHGWGGTPRRYLGSVVVACEGGRGWGRLELAAIVAVLRSCEMSPSNWPIHAVPPPHHTDSASSSTLRDSRGLVTCWRNFHTGLCVCAWGCCRHMSLILSVFNFHHDGGDHDDVLIVLESPLCWTAVCEETLAWVL